MIRPTAKRELTPKPGHPGRATGADAESPESSNVAPAEKPRKRPSRSTRTGAFDKQLGPIITSRTIRTKDARGVSRDGTLVEIVKSDSVIEVNASDALTTTAAPSDVPRKRPRYSPTPRFSRSRDGRTAQERSEDKSLAAELRAMFETMQDGASLTVALGADTDAATTERIMQNFAIVTS